MLGLSGDVNETLLALYTDNQEEVHTPPTHTHERSPLHIPTAILCLLTPAPPSPHPRPATPLTSPKAALTRLVTQTSNQQDTPNPGQNVPWSPGLRRHALAPGHTGEEVEFAALLQRRVCMMGRLCACVWGG